MNSMCPPDKGDVRRPGTKSQLYAATHFGHPLCSPILPTLRVLEALCPLAGSGSGSGLAKQFCASGATVPPDICLARTFYRTKTSLLSALFFFWMGMNKKILFRDDLFVSWLHSSFQWLYDRSVRCCICGNVKKFKISQ